MVIIPELKEKCIEILNIRPLYIDDMYDMYESIFGIKLDTDLAITIHKLIIAEFNKEPNKNKGN